MRAPLLFTIIFSIHAVAIGAFISLQGCATQQSTAKVEPPPNPVMPPKRTKAPATSTVAKRYVPPAPAAIRKAASATPAGEPYIIQKGDMLSKVAYRYSISTRELIEFNNITNPDKIVVGQKIYLPPHARKRSGTAAPRASSKPSASTKKSTKKSAAAAPATASGDAYVVRPGDSLSAIAKKYGVSVSALRSVNSLSGDRILVGQKLNLPVSAKKSSVASAPAKRSSSDIFAATRKEKKPSSTITSLQAVPSKPSKPEPPALDTSVEDTLSSTDTSGSEIDQTFEYTVQEGESLEAIAKAFIVSVEDIMKLNKIVDPASVRPGVKLKIPPSEF